jgi:FixJ family two-component response regulator
MLKQQVTVNFISFCRLNPAMAEPKEVSPIVYVVDDDPSVRDALGLMLRYSGYRAELFPDAESFLAAFQGDWAGCVVADLRLPGMSGIELQARLRERRSAIPFVIITAHGDVPTARKALRAQAVDFIEKPFEDSELRDAIDTAFSMEQRRIALEATERAHADKLASLSVREREVLEFAATGLHAREIAVALGISPRTVEIHKQHIMEKLGVRNVAELVRFALGAELRSK